MNEVRSHRVFFALWPDQEAVGHMAALAHSLTGSGSGRLMRPATLHLTLAFIGSVTPTRLGRLERIAGGIRAPAFDLSLDRLGFWPQRGILWAGCSKLPLPLRALSERLAAALRDAGFAIDHRSGAAQVAHVTLARGIRCALLPRLETPVCWRVDEFALVETYLHPSAASYKTLASFPLAEVATG